MTTDLDIFVELIVEEWDCWNYTCLPILIYQRDLELYENITKIIRRETSKGRLVYANLLLSLTKKYNNMVISKYGVGVLFRGLEAIVYDVIASLKYEVEEEYDLDYSRYINPFQNGDRDVFKRRSVSQANRLKIYQHYNL